MQKIISGFRFVEQSTHFWLKFKVTEKEQFIMNSLDKFLLIIITVILLLVFAFSMMCLMLGAIADYISYKYKGRTLLIERKHWWDLVSSVYRLYGDNKFLNETIRIIKKSFILLWWGRIELNSSCSYVICLKHF